LWTLALLAVVSIGLAAVGPMWSRELQREREQELLRVGVLYAQAIESYYRVSPGAVKSLPTSLDQLVLDTRFVGMIRHLRRIYTDPTNPGQPFAILRAPEGGVIGVASQNTARPLMQTAWSDGRHALAPAEHYSDWQFLAKVEP